MIPLLGAGSRPAQGTTADSSDHVVLFYEADQFLLDSVANYLGVALRADDYGVLVSTPAHRTGVESRLTADGVDLGRARAAGQYVALDARTTLRTIGTQADKLGRLVNELLDVTRLDSGKLVLERKSTDLVALLEQVVEVTPLLSNQHTTVLAVPSTLECESDPLRIEQVLINLLDNAVNYSPADEPIEVAMKDCSSWIEVSVRDRGRGIEPDKRDHIFDRFFQAHENGGRTGLGLGLYLSRNIVELHGGTIEAQYPPDGGTRFVVRLPR